MHPLLLVTVEGMGTSLIGAYGSNVAVTPTLDRLAAQGIVFDQCFVDSQAIAQQLNSLLTTRHVSQASGDESAVWQLLQQQGVRVRFLTDNDDAAQWAEAAECAAVTLIQPPRNDRPETDVDDCSVVPLFAAAAEELSASDVHGLLWIHSSGLRLPWDAPLSLRAQFTDPDDPEPPADVGPPAFDLTADTDPDAVVGWGQVAAAQISIIDDCIASLLTVLRDRPDAADWACSVIGLGSVPLGEHGRVGWGRPQLHGEELQCAAIVCPSPVPPIGWRRAELCQLPDIGATLRECCGLPPDIPHGWGRSLLQWIPSDIPQRWHKAHQLALCHSASGIWLRSPAWSARWSTVSAEDAERAASQPSLSQASLSLPNSALPNSTLLNPPLLLNADVDCQLYVKPDDRWEVSEIAARCPDIVDMLRDQAQAMWAALQNNDRDSMPELAKELCDLLR